jgi:hypothetical protein
MQFPPEPPANPAQPLIDIDSCAPHPLFVMQAVKSRNTISEISSELETTKSKAHQKEKELMALVRQTIAQHADEIQDRVEEAHKLKQHAAYAKNEAAKALKEEQVSHAATKERLTQERVALASRSGSRLLFCLMKYKLLDEDYKVCEARVVHARLVVWYQRSRASTLYNWYQTQVEELKEEVTETTQKHQEAQESADKGWRAAGKAEKQIGRAKAEVDEMAAAFNSEIKLQKRKFKQDAKDLLETRLDPTPYYHIWAYNPRFYSCRTCWRPRCGLSR